MAVDAKTDGEALATWVRVALFGDAVGALAPRLTKGAEVYCEGRLTLGTWTDRDGEAKGGSTLRRGRSRRWGRSDGGNVDPTGGRHPSEPGATVLGACGQGDITPDEAATLLQAISAQARVVEVEELTQRVALEQALQR